MSQNLSHTITLRAIDGTSVVFQRIGQSAQTAAAQVTAAGQKATAALNQEAAATDKAAASTTKLGSAAGAAGKGISGLHGALSGAAFGTFLGFLSEASRAAAEDEAAFTRLETAVTATGQSYGTYANSLDAAIVGAQKLSFADDAAANALATLTAQTQDAGKAQDLLAVAMDLARGKHIDLGTAATIVGKVAQGNTAILQRYGITIDANASSTEALAELQNRFAGQAEAFSQTQGGAIARVQENLDNMVESIGGALGPMQTWLALLPGVSAGMSLSGAAAGALADALLGTAAAETAVGAAGVAAAPALAGLAAVALPLAAVLAGGVVVAVLAKNIIDTHQAAEEAVDPVNLLSDAIDRMAASSQNAAAIEGARALLNTWRDVATEVQAAAKAANDQAFNQLNDVTTGAPAGVQTSDLLTVARIKGNKAVEDALVANQQYTLSTEQAAEAERLLNTILGETGDQLTVDTNLAQGAIAQWRAHELATVDLIRVLTDLTSSQQNVDDSTVDLSGAMGEATASMNLYADAAATAGRGAGVMWDAATANTEGYIIKLAEARQAAQDVATAADNLVSRQAQQIFKPTSVSGGGLGVIDTGAQQAEAAATQRALDTLKQEEDDLAQFTDKARTAAEAHAQAMDGEANAAVQTADSLIGSMDDREQATIRAAQAQEQYAERVGEINDNLAGQLSDLQEGYADQTAAIAQRRVDIEEAAAEKIKDLNQQRIDAATDAEKALADVASQRADVVANADQQAQRAEAAWMQSNQDNLDQQAEVRDKLQQTTADAAQKFNDLNAQNLEQQRQIRIELQATISQIQAQLHDAQAEAQRDLQRLAQDHRTAMADFRLDAKRIEEDLQLVLNDPRATAEQKNAAELAAQRARQDLAHQERDEETQHERQKADIKQRERDAEAQAADDMAAARQKARDDERALAQERADAMAAYQKQVSDANQQAAQQEASLEEQRQRALDAYQQQQSDAHEQVASQLEDLDKREQDILDSRAQKYADIEDQRQKLQAETAKQEQALNAQAAEAEQKFNEATAQAQDDAAKARMDAQQQYAEATKSDMTELQKLREEGLITEGEYQKIYNDLIEVQQTSKDIEDQKLLTAIKQIDVQQQLLDIEKAKAKAAAKGDKEPPDPLDTPPRKLLGGMARLGTLVGEAGSELAIRGGRMWEVGLSGPEMLNLASGTLIMPHGAAQSRMRHMALGGHAIDSVPQMPVERDSRRSGGAPIYNYGTITIKVDNAEVGNEIARQLAGRER